MKIPITILLLASLFAASCGEPPMPPSDEEMIRHFATHERAFRKVYGLISEGTEGSYHYPPSRPDTADSVSLRIFEEIHGTPYEPFELHGEDSLYLHGLSPSAQTQLDSLLGVTGCDLIHFDRRKREETDSGGAAPYDGVLLPRHRGCGNVQEFHLRSRIGKPPEYPYHRTRRPERDLPKDIQRHHAVQARQGRLVHQVRPFTIT